MKTDVFLYLEQNPKYISPIVETTMVAVEHGFGGSYGENGSAGGDLGNGGEFEL